MIENISRLNEILGARLIGLLHTKTWFQLIPDGELLGLLIPNSDIFGHVGD